MKLPSSATPPSQADRVVGGLLFGVSGLLVLVDVLLAVVMAFTSGGIDVRVGESQAQATVFAATVGGWSAVAVFAIGLIVCWVQLKRERPILFWAVLDVGIMVLIFVLMGLGSGG